MFKNVIAYRFNKPFAVDSAALELAMEEFKFFAVEDKKERDVPEVKF